MSTVAVYYAHGNTRSERLAKAAYSGVKAVGDSPLLVRSVDFKKVNCDYAVFYGLAQGLTRVFSEYKEKATAIYIDLGYWHRRINTRFDGYHKVVVNSRHPTQYFQNKEHDPSRFKELGLEVKPWQKNKHGKIIVAGMSEKAALADGLAPSAWERAAIDKLKELIALDIVYRPKPSCRRSRSLPNSFFDKTTPLNVAFKTAYALVTRQSNTAVDALLQGVPVFCEIGVASVMSGGAVAAIHTPSYPEGRQRWVEDIAWCQFTTAEIAKGLPFMHLKNEGLIP